MAEAPGPVTIEVLGRLAEMVGKAAETAQLAVTEAARVTTVDAVSRRWRKWWRRAGVALALLIVGLLAINTYSSHQSNRILTATQVICSKHVQIPSLGCENHKVLLQVETILNQIEAATGASAQDAQRKLVREMEVSIVNETDCRTREDVLDGLHLALPDLALALPATTTCPALHVGP